MKTIKDLKDKIVQSEKEIKLLEKDKSNNHKLIYRKIKKQLKLIVFYRYCSIYLESKPKKEYLISEGLRIKKILSVINERYITWLNTTPEANGSKNPRSMYDTEMRVKTLKLQYKTLDFLIN